LFHEDDARGDQINFETKIWLAIIGSSQNANNMPGSSGKNSEARVGPDGTNAEWQVPGAQTTMSIEHPRKAQAHEAVTVLVSQSFAEGRLRSTSPFTFIYLLTHSKSGNNACLTTIIATFFPFAFIENTIPTHLTRATRS
jgi:hypothetical protein